MKRTLKRTVVYPHSIERVWRALTCRDALAQWLMPNDFEPVVGSVTRIASEELARRSSSETTPYFSASRVDILASLARKSHEGVSVAVD